MTAVRAAAFLGPQSGGITLTHPKRRPSWAAQAHRCSVCHRHPAVGPHTLHGLTRARTAEGLSSDKPYSASAQPMAAAEYSRRVSSSLGTTVITARHRVQR